MSHSQIYATYSLSSSVSDCIHRVGRLLRHELALFFRARNIDMTPEQWRLLLRLAEKDGQSHSMLADPLLNDRPNISRIVDALEKRKLIYREISSGDRRNILIFLTGAGKEFINMHLADIIEAKTRYYDGLNETEIKELYRILAVIEKNFL